VTWIGVHHRFADRPGRQRRVAAGSHRGLGGNDDGSTRTGRRDGRGSVRAAAPAVVAFLGGSDDGAVHLEFENENELFFDHGSRRTAATISSAAWQPAPRSTSPAIVDGRGTMRCSMAAAMAATMARA